MGDGRERNKLAMGKRWRNQRVDGVSWCFFIPYQVIPTHTKLTSMVFLSPAKSVLTNYARVRVGPQALVAQASYISRLQQFAGRKSMRGLQLTQQCW
jgi:hypothetical protein